MVKIRLARYGTKKRPFYKIVVADSRFARDGRFIERVGYFNPIKKGSAHELQVNLERIQHWKKNGAKISKRTQKIIQLSNQKEGIS